MAMYNEITVEAELTNTEYMITKNYNLLENKPQINSVELVGNKSLEDLGINPDAEENIIDTVKVNGAALTPDANKAVDVTITTGTNNGTVKVNGTDVNIKGLKSAAYTESSAYDVSGAAAIVQGNVDALTVVVNGKVDKVSGKGLSQNDYTNVDKTKLAGIQAGAQVNTVTSVAGKTGAVTLNKSDVGLGNVDNTSDANKPISNATQTALNLKVDKVEGKGLSTEDFTTAEKTKLAGISAQANKVEITPVVTEGTTLATISIDGVDTDIKGSDIDVDDELSPTSENPLQNKAIYNLLQDLLPEETEEGNPIGITDASGLNAKSCEVSFSPIQSGSGEPSPENVRPISGWDSLVLNQTGVNQWDEEWEVGMIDNSGIPAPASSRIRSKNFISVLPNTTYYSKNMAWLFFYGNTAHTSFIDKVSIVNGTFTVPSTAHYMKFYTASGYGETYKNDISLNYPATDTNYHAYQGLTTHTATFPSTVYGGEYEFVSGKVKSEWGYIASYNGETITEPWISDRDVYVAGTTPSTGAEVCYKLATPTEITLTPETIELLKGNNTLWTDGDSVKLVYSADIKAYIDSQLSSLS